MFVKGLLVKKLFDENLEFAIDGDNVVARKHNTTILIPGNVYRAELDGEVYETSARKITNDDASLVFDNFEIRDYYASDNIEVTIYNSSNTAARSVKIYSVNHNANKINPDLLPDNIGGGASSWNDLKDKPFEEEAERRIVWTAATDVTDFITPHGQRNIYYKISDEVFGVDDLKGAYFFVNGNAATRIDLNEATEVQGGCSFSNKFCSIYDTEVNLGIAYDGMPDTFPSTGTYVAMVQAYDVEFVIPSRVTKKLDEKFLPRWNELKDAPFGEEPPLFDIRWDGKAEGHEVVELWEQLCVKIDDFVPSNPNELIGAKLTTVYYDDGHEEVTEATGDVVEDYNGAIYLYGAVGEVAFIYDVDTFASTNEIPSGVLSNGVWAFVGDYAYISALTAPTKVKKLDSKYLPTLKIFLDSDGNYTSNMTYDEILEAISADPFLSGMFIDENNMNTTEFIKILTAYWLPDQWNDYQLILWFGKDGDKVLINPQNEISAGANEE